MYVYARAGYTSNSIQRKAYTMFNSTDILFITKLGIHMSNGISAISAEYYITLNIMHVLIANRILENITES